MRLLGNRFRHVGVEGGVEGMVKTGVFGRPVARQNEFQEKGLFGG
jgi:hypothetical protein